MTNTLLFSLSITFLLYALFSNKFQKWAITGPMIFTACGLLIGEKGLTVLNLESHLNIIEILAELTLMLVLFSDANKVSFKYLAKYKKYPIRLLLIAFPLCMVFGVLVGLPILKGLGLWEVALVAAILAPTDAALGKYLVGNKNIPSRVRDTINVESGLNDGLALPFVLLFAFMAQKTSSNIESGLVLMFILKQLVLGPLAGYIIGKYGAKLINFSAEKKLISQGFDGIYALSLAAISFSVAKAIGGNSFIAVYFTGLFFGNYVIKPSKFIMEFTESEGQILTLATFIFFGALLPMALDEIKISWVLYALLSLTVVRMIPTALSVIGSKPKPINVLLVGWFGPRGVASILYLVMIKSKFQIENIFLIAQVVMLTIFLSIFLHGLSAIPIVKYYPKED